MRATPVVSSASLLSVRDLCVSYPGPSGALRVVDGVSLELTEGEFLGIVGESGSGKTQLLLSLMGLNAPNAQLTGSIRYRGEELVGAPQRALSRLRGARIGMVFQD
ncbi:MAG: ATP-binding cassette domain-containing protein, partial [Steroidobacteraceae bacterium]